MRVFTICSAQGKLNCSVASRAQWSAGAQIDKLTFAIEAEPVVYDGRDFEKGLIDPLLSVKIAAIASSSNYLECQVCANSLQLFGSETMLGPSLQLAEWTCLQQQVLPTALQSRSKKHTPLAMRICLEAQVKDAGFQIQTCGGQACRVLVPAASVSLKVGPASFDCGLQLSVDLFLLNLNPLLLPFEATAMETAGADAFCQLHVGLINWQLEQTAASGLQLKVCCIALLDVM